MNNKNVILKHCKTLTDTLMVRTITQMDIGKEELNDNIFRGG